MNEYSIILIAVAIPIVLFTVSMTKGVMRLLASAIAAVIALTVFFLGVNLLPGLVDTYLKLEISWKVNLILSGSMALVFYIGCLFAALFILKRAFNQGSPLHNFVDGFKGGLLSLFPSLVALFFLFCCVRIAGTVLELNYAASISQEGIETSIGKIPDYPLLGDMRNGVERIPLVAKGLDLIDPFSNRKHRNAAAFVMMHGSGVVRSFLLSRPDTAPIAQKQTLLTLRSNPGINKALKNQDRLGLVLNPLLWETSETKDLGPLLEDLVLKPAMVDFVASIRPEEVDSVEGATDQNAE